MLSHTYDTYWNQTETYEALKVYIQMNMDGLKDAVVKMMAKERVAINTGTFTNDMTTFAGRDDVLTLLVHELLLCIQHFMKMAPSTIRIRYSHENTITAASPQQKSIGRLKYFSYGP